MTRWLLFLGEIMTRGCAVACICVVLVFAVLVVLTVMAPLSALLPLLMLAALLVGLVWAIVVVAPRRRRVDWMAGLPPTRPPGTRKPRAGATLMSVMVALGIITVCLTMALQAHLQGGRYVANQARRAAALGACQAEMEQLRAGGYGRLPSEGQRAFAVEGQQTMEGTVTVGPGPVSASRTVTVRVSWRSGEVVPGGQVELATVMTARGIGG